MTVATVLVLLATAPAIAWTLAALATAARRAWRRRGTVEERRRRLAHLLGGGDLAVVPTGDVDLTEAEVRAVAAGAGMRLLGYEAGPGPFRRRSGVFVRIGGGVDAVLEGARRR